LIQKFVVAGNHELIVKAYKRVIFGGGAEKFIFGFVNVNPGNLNPKISFLDDPSQIVLRVAAEKREAIIRYNSYIRDPLIGISIIPELSGGGILFSASNSIVDVREIFKQISGKNCRIFVGICSDSDLKSEKNKVLVINSSFRFLKEADVVLFCDPILHGLDELRFGAGHNIFSVRIPWLLPKKQRERIEEEIVSGIARNIYPAINIA